MRFASNPLMDYNSFLKTVFLHCVESRVLPNFHHFSLKNVFVIKSTHGITPFLENCVFLHCGLKTACGQVFTISHQKMRLTSNPLVKYNSFWKTVFCAMVIFLKIKTSEQHRATNLVNLFYYPTGFV